MNSRNFWPAVIIAFGMVLSALTLRPTAPGPDQYIVFNNRLYHFPAAAPSRAEVWDATAGQWRAP